MTKRIPEEVPCDRTSPRCLCEGLNKTLTVGKQVENDVKNRATFHPETAYDDEGEYGQGSETSNPRNPSHVRHHDVSWKKILPQAEYPGFQVNTRMMCRQSREDLSTLRLRGTSMFGIGFIRTALNVESCMMKCALRCLSW